MKLESKKNEIAGKMDWYKNETSEQQSKNRIARKGKPMPNHWGIKKGRESLNSPKRGRDNDVALGKNEQEKS